MDASDDGITVTGVGRAGEVPDVFVVDLSASQVAESPAVALEQAGNALIAMREAALAEGLAPSDLTTRDLQIHQHFDHQGQPAGYAAELALTLRVTGGARPGELVSACVGAGGSAARLLGTHFENSDPSGAMARAREAAFADARVRALQYAALAERELGAVVSVVEGGSVPRPYAAERMKLMSAGPPIDPGTLDLTASVTVSWAWSE